MIAHINIGSNIGDRMANIDRAVAALESTLGTTLTLSTPIHSEPWGYESENTYTNIGACFNTTLTPLQLLNTLLDVEHNMNPTPHRTPTGEYADRAIDIDLIAMEGICLHSPRLILPHPHMHLREFVLKPMIELMPEWRHPLLALTPGQLLLETNPNCS